MGSLLPTFGYCFSSSIRMEYGRCFRDIISEHVGQGQIGVHLQHSFILQYLVPMAKNLLKTVTLQCHLCYQDIRW